MKSVFVCCASVVLMTFLGCSAAQQRGMSGATYISTARPAITLQAVKLPLFTAGEGQASLLATSMPVGAPVRVWLAVYGDAPPESPMAIVAHAELQRGWYWDGIMRRPFSVDEGVEVLGNLELQACTYIVNSERDPFGTLISGGDGAPVRWIARGFAARTNFYQDKIILEYRERLPQDINSLTALPYGRGDFVRAFEQRAREGFIVAGLPPETAALKTGYANAVRWRYMDERFLGTASKHEFNSRF